VRRKENEINNPDTIIEIINRATVCRLAMCNGDMPYVVPVSFGFKDNKLYIHSSLRGQKIDIINKNNNVCVEFDIDSEMVKTGSACKWGFKYKSVIGFGTAHFVYDFDQKTEALDIIMSHYADGEFKYDKRQVEACLIIRVDIKSLTGKQSL
jgi:uncharacterized protein